MDNYIKNLITDIEKANLKLNSLKMQKDLKTKNSILTEIYAIQENAENTVSLP